MTNPLQLTFALIKPHVCKNPVALNGLHNLILASNFKIVRSKITNIDKNLASEFYKEHKTKFFYNRLLTFMCSGPSEALILTTDNNSISKWREVMGPTKVYKTIFSHPNSIRGLFGLSDTRNACHGSDSPESVQSEIKIFFPEFSIPLWHINEETFFRKNRIRFNEKLFVHEVVQ